VSDGAIRGCVVECYGRACCCARCGGGRWPAKDSRRKLDSCRRRGADREARGSDDGRSASDWPAATCSAAATAAGSESIAANLDQLGVVVHRSACDPFVVDRYVLPAPACGQSRRCSSSTSSTCPATRRPFHTSSRCESSGCRPLVRLVEPLPELITALTATHLLAGQSGVGKSVAAEALRAMQFAPSALWTVRRGPAYDVSSAIIRQPWGELPIRRRTRLTPPSCRRRRQRGFMEIGASAAMPFQDSCTCANRNAPCRRRSTPVPSTRDAMKAMAAHDLNRQLDDKRGWRA